MQAGTRRIGKHVKHIKLGTILVFGYLVGLVVGPCLLPLLFNFLKIILHRYIVVSCYQLNYKYKDVCKVSVKSIEFKEFCLNNNAFKPKLRDYKGMKVLR